MAIGREMSVLDFAPNGKQWRDIILEWFDTDMSLPEYCAHLGFSKGAVYGRMKRHVNELLPHIRYEDVTRESRKRSVRKSRAAKERANGDSMRLARMYRDYIKRVKQAS